MKTSVNAVYGVAGPAERCCSAWRKELSFLDGRAPQSDSSCMRHTIDIGDRGTWQESTLLKIDMQSRELIFVGSLTN